MIYTAISIFGLTAIIGLYLLTLLLRDKQIPKGAAIIHGLFAVTGLVLLIVYCIKFEAGPLESIIIFSIAALGGIILGYKDLTGRKIPKWLGIVHGVTAIAGFGFLLVYTFC
jgi:hypothetical protein